MNKYRKIKIFFILCVISLPLFLNAAASEYKLLEPITGGQTSVTSGGDIEKYIQSGYNYLLGLAVALSVLMLVIGGVEYTMTFASEGKKGEAKKRIEDAITGLLIALLSYAVLYTINPNLTRMTVPGVDESCDATTAGRGGTGAGGTRSGGTSLKDIYKSKPAGTEEEVRKELVDGGTIETKVKCPPGQEVDCVNLNGLGSDAVEGLKDLKISCENCNLFVSGGTEGGHSTHCVGCNQVDLRHNSKLDSYILGNKKSEVYTTKGREYTMENGDKYLNEGDHWHVYFRNQEIVE